MFSIADPDAHYLTDGSIVCAPKRYGIGPLDLPLHMLEVTAYGGARAAADDGPPEQALEAGHPVAA